MSSTKKNSKSLQQIRLEKLRAEHPEMFSVTGLPRLDLRAFQKFLLTEQRKHRLIGMDRVLARMRAKKHAIRVRQPAVADCRVTDTRKDSSGKKLYFELSNGQAIRADRAEDRGLKITTRKDGSGWDASFKKGRRYLPLQPLLSQIAIAEIEKNASRA
jgi:hypothetical protein